MLLMRLSIVFRKAWLLRVKTIEKSCFVSVTGLVSSQMHGTLRNDLFLIDKNLERSF